MRISLFVLGGLTLLATAADTGPAATFTATTTNVQGAPASIRIDLFRWSTPAEGDHLLAAWSGKEPAPKKAPEGAGRGGRGRGGRGAGGPAEKTAPRTPESALAAALAQAPIVGHLWSPEVAGYSVRYAVKLAGQDGGERIILITDRRLGAFNSLWQPMEGTTTDYEFSLIELRLNSKGEGEGKVSLTGKVALAGDTLALENYAASPVVLKNVRTKPPNL